MSAVKKSTLLYEERPLECGESGKVCAKVRSASQTLGRFGDVFELFVCGFVPDVIRTRSGSCLGVRQLCESWKIAVFFASLRFLVWLIKIEKSNASN